MNVQLHLIVLCLIITVAKFQDCPKLNKILYCYYGSWALYREGIGKFTTEHIEPQLCTHIVYSFAGLDLFGHIGSLDNNADFILGGYANVTTKLKVDNPCLKTILAIGGWSEGSRKYSLMALTDYAIEDFAQTVIKYLVYYGFDGLDFDWEYPGQRGGIPDDHKNFPLVLESLKNKFKSYNLELSIAVPLKINDDYGYNVAEIAKHADHVNLMAYDYTSTELGVTGLNSPLTPIKETVQYWIKSGLPSEKLLLGIAAYAKTFNLKNSIKNSIGDEGSAGLPGKYTNQEGFLSYYELLIQLKTGKYVVHPVEKEVTTYATYSKSWITYDSLNDIRNKAQYALENKLGGAIIWSMDFDDFLGQYSDKTYPVINAVKEVLNIA